MYPAEQSGGWWCWAALPALAGRRPSPATSQSDLVGGKGGTAGTAALQQPSSGSVLQQICTEKTSEAELSCKKRFPFVQRENLTITSTWYSSSTALVSPVRVCAAGSQ